MWSKKERIKEIIKWFFEIMIIVIYIILFKYDYINIERLLNVLIVIICILFYLFIIKLIIVLIKYYIKDKVSDEYIVTDYVRENYETVGEIIRILNIIRNIMNPSFVIILKLCEKIYFFFRYINWRFEKNKKFRRILYIIIRNWILYPILKIHRIYYKMLKRWRSKAFINSLFWGFEGVVMLIYLLDMHKYINYYYLIIVIYLFLVSSEYWPKKMRVKWLSCVWFTKLYYILHERNENTLIGEIISLLYKKFCLKINDILIDNPFFALDDNKIIYLIKRYIVFIEEEKFLKTEIKNKPSLLLFLNLYHFDEDLRLYFFGKIKLENELKWKNSEELKEIIRLYEIEKSRCKRVIFYVWEVEEWLNIKRSKVYISLYYMTISFTRWYILMKQEMISEDLWTTNNFKIEGKEANFVDFKDYYNRIYIDMLSNQIITKKDNKNVLDIIKRAGYDFSTYRDSSTSNNELRELFKEEMEEFIKEMEEEWEKKKS